MTTLEDAITEIANNIGVSAFTVQVDTPDAASLAFAENTLRGIPGVRSSNTTSLALGGYSVIYVNFAGNIDLLKTSLASRGWTVESGTDTLRIHRLPAAPAP